MTIDLTELRRMLEAYQNSPSWGVPSTHEALSDALVDAAPALLAVVEAARDWRDAAPCSEMSDNATYAMLEALKEFE